MVSLQSVAEHLDRVRPSENVFVGIRIDGTFRRLMLRAACPAAPGEGLVEATRHQSEFDAGDVVGTLVGFWAPPYVNSVSVPGYHFHFMSADRSLGGHVFDLATDRAEIGVHVESDLHIAIPESSEFLEADLAGEHQQALEIAETSHGRAAEEHARRPNG